MHLQIGSLISLSGYCIRLMRWWRMRRIRAARWARARRLAAAMTFLVASAAAAVAMVFFSRLK